MGVILENVLTAHGLPVNALLRVTSIGTILNMVAAGLGITITCDNTAEPYENSLNHTSLFFEKTLYQNPVIATSLDRYSAIPSANASVLHPCVWR